MPVQDIEIPDGTETASGASASPRQNIDSKAKASFVQAISEYHGKEKPAATAPAGDPPKAPPKTDQAKPETGQPSQAARENFKKLETERDELRKKYDTDSAQWKQKTEEYEGKLKTMNGFDPQAIESDRKQLGEYKDLIERFYVEHSPQFQQVFGSRIDAVLSDVKNIAGEHAESAMELFQAPPSKARDKAFKALVGEMDDVDRARMISAYDRMTDVQRERAEALNKSKEGYRALQTRNGEEQAKVQAQAKERAAKLEAQVMKEAESISDLEGIDKDQDAAAYRTAYVKKALSSDFSPTEAAKIPGLAAEALRLREKVIPGLIAELKKRDEQIAALQGSSPSLGGGAHGAKQSPHATSRTPFKDALLQNWNR